MTTQFTEFNWAHTVTGCSMGPVLTTQLVALLNLRRASFSSRLSLWPLASLPSSLCSRAEGLRLGRKRTLWLPGSHHWKQNGHRASVDCASLASPGWKERGDKREAFYSLENKATIYGLQTRPFLQMVLHVAESQCPT